MKNRNQPVWQTMLVVVATLLWCGCSPAPQRSPSSPSAPSTTGGSTTDVDADDTEIESSQPAEPAAVETPADTEPEKMPTEPAESTEIELTPPENQPSAPEAQPPATDQPADETPAAAPPAEDQSASEPSAPETAGSAVEAAPAAAVAADAPSADRVVTGDWPCWGGDAARNMVNATTGFSDVFTPKTAVEDPQRLSRVPETSIDDFTLLWKSSLGSQTYGNPVVSGGKVWVGTNNGGEYRPQHKGDRGVLLCFDEKTGEFLWQLTREKLPQGRVNDWPEQGICSAPAVEGNRLWVVTNRCELMCLDTEGFLDGKNDGPYTDEVDADKQDADIIWSLDMMDELGVFPHNLATSSPLVYEDLVLLLTSNGVDEAHLELPSPRAPSFIAVNKLTGEVVWEDNTPFDTILHGQWSSPALGVVDGQAQVYMPGGDGWLYALDAKTGEHIWKFDLNPKDSKWELGGRGTRNNIIATPVFYQNSVVLGVGQDPEHGEGVGHIYRIGVTKRGDVSPMTEDGQPNPNSAQIWHWGGVDQDGSKTGEAGVDAFRRTLSTVAIHDGLVYAPDLSGRIHCLDFETGQRYYEADVMAAIWGSPMVVDGKVFIGNEDGLMSVFNTGKELKMASMIEFPSSIYSTPTIANGVMFVSDRSQLYAISTK
jgi:outer membrane protein assembly factor BamB